MFRAREVAFVSSRVPESVIKSVPGLRGLVHVVHDVSELAALRDGGLGPDGRLRVVVLDTKITPSNMEFDAVVAAQELASHPERAGTTLLWVHESPSSLHTAEEAARHFLRGRPLAGRLAGAVCDEACIVDALDAAYAGRQWTETHFDAQSVARRDVLFTELQRKSIGPEIMIATAAKPMKWDEMSSVLHKDVEYLRHALAERVRPALVRLGWLDPWSELTTPMLAHLVGQRRPYFERYAHRYTPKLASLFSS